MMLPNVRVPLSRDAMARLQAAMPKPPAIPAPAQSKREVAGRRMDLEGIYPLAGGWSVPSQSGAGRYMVYVNDEDRRIAGDVTPWSRRPSCTCPDHQFRRVRCRHIWAVFRKLAEEDKDNEI